MERIWYRKRRCFKVPRPVLREHQQRCVSGWFKSKPKGTADINSPFPQQCPTIKASWKHTAVWGNEKHQSRSRGGGSLVRNVQVCDSAGTRFTEQSKINNFPSLLPRAVIGVEETEKRERTFKEREDWEESALCRRATWFCCEAPENHNTCQTLASPLSLDPDLWRQTRGSIWSTSRPEWSHVFSADSYSRAEHRSGL